MNYNINSICQSFASEDDKIIYYCKICLMNFNSATTFSKHMKVGHSIKVLACRKCLEIFNDLGQLFVHDRQVHSNKTFATGKLQCSMCDYRTDNGGLMKHHSRVHSGNKPEICDVCNQGFTQLSNMRVHRKRHFKPSVEFFCEECDLTFANHDTLLPHKLTKEHKLISFLNRSMNVQIEIVCQICNFRSNFVEEIMMHGQVCPCGNSLACQDCFDKLPLDLVKLRDHRRFHREQNLMCWKCVEDCGNCEKFTSKTLLISHLIKMHDVAFLKEEVCRYCEKLFETKTDLTVHIDSEHMDMKHKHGANVESGRLQCEHQDCEFYTNSHLQLEKHLKSVHGKDQVVTGNETLPAVSADDKCRLPNQRGRPRLCDKVIVKNEGTDKSIRLEPIIIRKRGRPRIEKEEEEERIPKKRGRPKRHIE